MSAGSTTAGSSPPHAAAINAATATAATVRSVRLVTVLVVIAGFHVGLAFALPNK